MRLPIYRRLDEEFRLLGLSLKELAIVGVVFVGLGEILSFWVYGRVASVGLAILVFLFFQFANRRLEQHFLDKLIRHLQLPSSLGRKLWRSTYERKVMDE